MVLNSLFLSCIRLQSILTRIEVQMDVGMLSVAMDCTECNRPWECLLEETHLDTMRQVRKRNHHAIKGFCVSLSGAGPDTTTIV
jgi:hypothetical protein